MPFGLIGIGLMVWLGMAGGPVKSLAALRPTIAFDPDRRAVNNWRLEGVLHLRSSLGTTVNLLLGRDVPAVSRCVKLNNYWCIKRAGWAGEIAADAEGHVAFASAAEGADVAALLLRRYYLDYGRHSARAIVSRWAPASCGAAQVAAGPPRHPPEATAPPRGSAARARLRDDEAVVSIGILTTRGLGRTLRARFLASHGRRGAGAGRRRGRPSVVPDRLIGARTPTPSITAGLGRTPMTFGPQSLAGLPLVALPLADLSAPARGRDAAPDCGEDIRIAAYAAKAAAGVAASAEADLKLFGPDGSPTPNLARVLRNMSAVEIGPLGASAGLVDAAVDHARRMIAAPVRR